MRKIKGDAPAAAVKNSPVTKDPPSPGQKVEGTEKYFKRYPRKVAWTLKEVFGCPLS